MGCGPAGKHLRTGRSAVGDAALDAVESLEDQINGLAVLYLLGLLVAGIVFLVWQSRLRQASEALGAEGFRQSRGMAIGGWFIPFANFVLPKRAIDDLWRSADPEPPAPFQIAGRPSRSPDGRCPGS